MVRAFLSDRAVASPLIDDDGDGDGGIERTMMRGGSDAVDGR